MLFEEIAELLDEEQIAARDQTELIDVGGRRREIVQFIAAIVLA